MSSNTKIDDNKPVDMVLPPPPDGAVLEDIRSEVTKQVEEQTRELKRLPTPEDYTELKNDVRHLHSSVKTLWGTGITVVAGMIGIAIMLYTHLDNKLLNINSRLDSRLDSIFLQNHYNNNTVPQAPLVEPPDNK